MALQNQHPYIDKNGKKDYKHIKFFSDEGKPIIKTETGEEFEDAVDLYPSPYHYIEKPPEDEPEEVDSGEGGNL